MMEHSWDPSRKVEAERSAFTVIPIYITCLRSDRDKRRKRRYLK